MDLSYVKKVIKLVSDNDVDEVEIEQEGQRIRVVKAKNRSAHQSHPVVEHSVSVAVPPQPVPVPPPVQPAPAAASNLHEIKSPIVGTFYRSPAPDAPPFVETGITIQRGTVLCIVEAMKLMNEIESDVSGKVVKILVENGQPVEYDQTLFLVEKA